MNVQLKTFAHQTIRALLKTLLTGDHFLVPLNLQAGPKRHVHASFPKEPNKRGSRLRTNALRNFATSQWIRCAFVDFPPSLKEHFRWDVVSVGHRHVSRLQVDDCDVL
jgi:hypothetical protein